MENTALIEGIAVPFAYSNVDTDAIFPVSSEATAAEEGFGAALFGRWRSRPDFLLNRAEYRDASILVTGPNFGIGSSRETAVWALKAAGYRAIISSRFGDIFRSNCTRNGILAAQASVEACALLMRRLEERQGLTVSIDLAHSVASTADASVVVRLHIDEFSCRCLIDGMDELALLRGLHDAIDRVLESSGRWLPHTRQVVDRLTR